MKGDPGLEAQIFESVPLNVWSHLKKIPRPALVIRGEASNAFSKPATVSVKAVGPEFELQEIPRSGHFEPMEQPLACARVILTFLQKQKGSVKDKK